MMYKYTCHTAMQPNEGGNLLTEVLNNNLRLAAYSIFITFTPPKTLTKICTMKKLSTLFIVLLFCSAAFSQSQRLCLIEEFTGETCPPCASQNPGFNTLLNNNSTKIVSIKYQNNIPSTGPNFYLYNTADIANRTTYYSNNYSPHGFFDGNVWNNTVGGFTQSHINSRYNVASPFTISVTHTISPGNDSIYTHSVITCTQAVSGSLSARVAVCEREVFGYTSPNGESSYEHVMRKMLPDGTGTPLQTTWNVGDSFVLDLAWKIAASPTSYPGPVTGQLEVITFVQNNTSKEVLQTGWSHNIMPIDVATLSVSNLPVVTCASSLTPSVDLTNYGVQTVNTLDILYKLDNGSWTTYSWSGSLPNNGTVSAVLPAITVTPGSHKLYIDLANPNGTTDGVAFNNLATAPFVVTTLPAAGNVAEGFQPTTFPPANFGLYNGDLASTWSRFAMTGGGGYGLSTASARMDFFNSSSGETDILVLPGVDMTNATMGQLTFDIAHKRRNASTFDSLFIKVSTDCGLTWTNEYAKGGASLATVASNLATAYVPAAADWRTDVVDLTAYIGQPNVMITFFAKSNAGNNMYIDNINLNTVTGITNGMAAGGVLVYPNPASAQLIINNEELNINSAEITNALGAVVWSASNITTGKNLVDVSHLAKGIYFIKITAQGKALNQKLVIE